MIGKLSTASQIFLERIAAYQLTDLLELTYAYEQKWEFYYNKTLFESFVDCRACKQREEIDALCISRLKEILVCIEEYEQAIQNIPSSTWWDKICLHWAEYAHDILHIILWWLPFELEKAGYSSWLSEVDKQDRVLAIQEIEYKWFGPLVSQETFETSRSVAMLKQLIIKHAKRISKEEKELMAWFINQAMELKHYHIELEESEDPERIMDDEPQFQQQIPRDIYKKVFELSLSFYGLKVPVVIDERSSIYDGWSALHIPDSAWYATLPLQKVIELIQHEIETHYVIQANTKYLLGSMRGWSNLLREEGLAKFNEEVINGANLASFDISPSISQMMMGEILSWEDFAEFMRIYRKLQWKEERAQGYFLRRKRNYPLDLPGIQHKDTSYSRGRFAVRSYLMNGWSYESLYIAKVNFDDMDILEYSLSQSEKGQLLHPLFLAERILYHFLFKDTKDIGFEKYMSIKRPFLDTERYKEPLTKYQSDRLRQIIELLSE